MEKEHPENSVETAPSVDRKILKSEAAIAHRASETLPTLHAREPIYTAEDRWRGILRYRDQITLIVCCTIAMLALGGYMFWNEQVTHQVIEIERMPYVETPLQIDVKSAPWTEFALIPGIGEQKAREIIRVRNELGGAFADENELLKVEGIGPKTLDVMRPYLVPMPDASARAER
ncbi:MAG: helix-hairpin-helix domain-containing protein [Thermoguttaceae bacterium]|nr:helix-hairpin-helix domain-containing protein [Thermoguttaceae bacterium]